MERTPDILILGVCAAGKTTLSAGLRDLGYSAQSLAQEHSSSPYLYKRRRHDILILLECSYPTVKKRKTISWGEEKLLRQKVLLTDARQNAHLIVQTDSFGPLELVSYVDGCLRKMGIAPAKDPRGL